jgi:hypothetical protein
MNRLDSARKEEETLKHIQSQTIFANNAMVDKYNNENNHKAI